MRLLLTLPSPGSCHRSRCSHSAYIDTVLSAHPTATFSPTARPAVVHRKHVITCGFGDELLDYITAGPKLRKWYGEGERMPTDGGGLRDDLPAERLSQEGEDTPRTAVLVTDADNPTAEQVVLQLILARQEVKVLVKDVSTAITAYGSYIAPVQGHTGNGQAVQSALRGVRAVVCTGRLGDLLRAAEQQSVDHLIVVSSAGSSAGGFSLDSFMDAEASAQRSRSREEAVSLCSVPHTIVQIGRIRDEPGGQQAIAISQGGDAVAGEVCREDLARVLVECLQHPPKKALVFQVQNRPQGDFTEDLASQMSRLREAAVV